MRLQSCIIALVFLVSLYFIPRASCQWVQANGIDVGTVSCFSVRGFNLFVGADSSILRSTDNGRNWLRISTFNKAVTALIENDSIFFAIIGGHVYRSMDSAVTWIPTDSGLPDYYYNIAFARSSDNLFITTRKGVFRLAGNGTSWQKTAGALLDSIPIPALTADGHNIYAGYDGGIIHSTDEGLTWKDASNGLKGKNIINLMAVGRNLFAGTYSQGIFFSSDSGAHWSIRSRGLPNSPVIRSFTSDGSNIFTGLYSTDAQNPVTGIYNSTDNGMNWNPVWTGPNYPNVFALAKSGTNLLAGSSGVYYSDDSGLNWLFAGFTPLDVFNHVINSLTKTGDTLIVGGTQGVSWTTDNGTTWTSSTYNGCGFGVNCLLIDRTSIFAGTNCNVTQSTDRGKNWVVVGLNGNSVYALFLLGSKILAGTKEGMFLSSDDGKSWVNTDLTNITINALAANGSNLFAATESGVFRSNDSGNSFTTANHGLTNNSVNALVVKGSYIFAGTSGAGVFRSTNEGMTWTSVNDGLTSSYIYCLSVYGNYLLAGTRDGGVFVSTNNGINWTAVNSGFYDLTYISIDAFENIGDYVFTGTSRGLWRRHISDFPIANVLQTVSPDNSLSSFPNPFNKSTTINFTSKYTGQSQITIVNLLGEEVARLYSGYLEAGEHTFTWDAHSFSDGTYFCVVRMNGKVRTLPLMLER
jgi:photosystem II stability/assembly factor-like uncharacterized protein